jgi:hypothetical protein
MSEPTPQTRGGRNRLLAVVVTAALVLAIAEWGSARWLANPADQPAAKIERPANVVLLAKDPNILAPPLPGPSVWIIGNSHTYTLPGLKRGDTLRDARGIVIDEVAERVERRYPNAGANFYLLSYPNFLPFEMLTRVGQLLHRGFRSKVVFLGLTFRNVARNSQPRYEVYTTYRDGPYAEAFETMLADPAVAADLDVVNEVHAQRRRVERDQEADRLRSDSDRLDETLTSWAANRVTLMGKSADLRAQIFSILTGRVQNLWDDRQTVKYSYDLIEHDYAFNLKCLEALLRLLKHSGATVICYYTPERTDLPALADPRREEEFMAAFNRLGGQLDVTVLDARHVVPNDLWGWFIDSPDRSHFSEPGHQRLADFLMEGADKQSAWKELSQP